MDTVFRTLGWLVVAVVWFTFWLPMAAPVAFLSLLADQGEEG